MDIKPPQVDVAIIDIIGKWVWAIIVAPCAAVIHSLFKNLQRVERDKDREVAELKERIHLHQSEGLKHYITRAEYRADNEATHRILERISDKQDKLHEMFVAKLDKK